MTQPYRYLDEDQFCLSARLLPDLNTGGVTDTLSITIEGSDEPQSVHVPAGDVPAVAAGIVAAAGEQPAATVPASASTDRAAVAAHLWAVAEHNIVAEWICCEPINPEHDLCVQGDATRRMVRALLVDDPDAYRPAPLLDAVLAEQTAADRAAILQQEAYRIRAHCPDHLDSDSQPGSWMVCHCDVADEMLRRLADAASGPGGAAGEQGPVGSSDLEEAGPEFKESAGNLNLGRADGEPDSYAERVNAPLSDSTITALNQRLRAGDIPVHTVRRRAAGETQRPRCPHCQMPHDLTPDVAAVCASIRASIAAEGAQQDEAQATPCSQPNACDGTELCGAHEREQAHAEGEHCFCGPECRDQEVVHACPPDGTGLTPCCGRTPFELPLTDRISSEATVTCPGPAAVSQPGKDETS